MAVVGLISRDDESACREEVERLSTQCRDNNVSLSVDKAKEITVDFRRTRPAHTPLSNNGTAVEIVRSTKFLSVDITEELTWTKNTTSLLKKAQQRLYFLRRLKEANLPPPILTMFYRGTIGSVLTNCITICYGSSNKSDHKGLQRVVKTAENIMGCLSLPYKPLFANSVSTRSAALCRTHHIPHMVISHSSHLREDTAASEPGLPGCVAVFTPRLSGSSTPCCPTRIPHSASSLPQPPLNPQLKATD
nr:uncharacterized protein LOC111847107 [Paramormyrops kingsleyae]